MLIISQPIDCLLADILAIVDVVEQLITDRVHLTVPVAITKTVSHVQKWHAVFTLELRVSQPSLRASIAGSVARAAR